MSFTLMPTSSTYEPVTISNAGTLVSRISISTCRDRAGPSRSCSRSRSRVRCACSRIDAASCRSRAAAAAAAAAGRAAVPRPPVAPSRAPPRALLAHHVHRQLDQIADHRLDVAPDVADLGELRRLDLDERRLRESRQPPRDLGLADAGRADHQDVLRRDLLGQLGRQLLTSHAVAQRNRHGALGLCCPTTYLSSSATICRGVSDSDRRSGAFRADKSPWLGRALRWSRSSFV